ncbi:MAG: M48 family metallopeptidase [Myxococcota bacterium]
MKLKTFPNLSNDAIMHPWDIKASAALAKVPGLELLTRKVMEYGFERVYYLENTADNVRVTPDMFPRLHRYLQYGCKILGVDEPEMYVTMDPVPHAYTYGHTRPFIVLSSGLIDMLDEQERCFVIGHELGHIKYEHVLYTVLAENLKTILEQIGKATLGIGSLLGFGLALPLLDWYRKAQLSCDRAGFLCVQDAAVPFRVLMKLAGGSEKLYGEMNAPEFMRQIRAYEEADESTLNKVYKVLLTAFRPHPYPIMRAKHLDTWLREEAAAVTGLDVDFSALEATA